MAHEPADLIASALRHLVDAGFRITLVANSDALRVDTPAGQHHYRVLPKPRVAPSTAELLATATDERPLLVTTYVSEQVGDALRRQDVHYIDTAGNMFLRADGLLLDVRGRRRSAAVPTAQPRPPRLFRPGGLKVLFALLARPDLVAASLRTIAAASGTSLGTVQWVLNELDQQEYISTVHNVRRLHRITDLFTRWVDAYTLELYPRLPLARYEAQDPRWWTNADDALQAEGALWGGETAAYHLDPHLLPERAVLYARQIPKHLALTYRFRSAGPEGNVEIRKRFWDFDDDQRPTVVPTLLVYADLIATAEPRQLEAAARLREQDAHLRRLSKH